MYRFQYGKESFLDASISEEAMLVNSMIPASFCYVSGFDLVHGFRPRQRPSAVDSVAFPTKLWNGDNSSIPYPKLGVYIN